MRASRRQPWLTFVLSALTLRAIMGLGAHSGMGKPPMYGDFEAQRHWLEVTLNLPLAQWYVQGPDNDLQYWGLDYPPLTAYHSLAMGRVLRLFHPEAVALHSSRGSESELTRAWMRFFALASDALSYIPVVCLFFAAQPSMALLALVSPAFVVIDHGHFQFNCVYHGLVILAVYLLRRSPQIKEWEALAASVAFCLAINFKIMALYFAPAFFFYLLAWCRPRPVARFFLLGTVVIGTFALMWSPFILAGCGLDVLHRIFPYERGLFEDKVANFWGTLNLVFKTREHFTKPVLGMASFSLTWLAVLPSCVHCFRYPSPSTFLWTLFNSSLAAFMFAFQVHEKTVLLPLLPMTLLSADVPGPAVWFSVLSVYSMSPLLLKDSVGLASACMTGLYVLLAARLLGSAALLRLPLPDGSSSRPIPWILASVVLCGALLLGLLIAVKPPSALPDLWVVLLNAFSSACLASAYVWGTWFQLNWGKVKAD